MNSRKRPIGTAVKKPDSYIVSERRNSNIKLTHSKSLPPLRPINLEFQDQLRTDSKHNKGSHQNVEGVPAYSFFIGNGIRRRQASEVYLGFHLHDSTVRENPFKDYS